MTRGTVPTSLMVCAFWHCNTLERNSTPSLRHSTVSFLVALRNTTPSCVGGCALPQKTRRILQDLARAFQLVILPLHALNLRNIIRGDTIYRTLDNVNLAQPSPQSFKRLIQLQYHPLSCFLISSYSALRVINIRTAPTFSSAEYRRTVSPFLCVTPPSFPTYEMSNKPTKVQS